MLMHWYWLAFGIILLMSELIFSGGFLLWVGLSAVTVGVITWIWPVLGIAWESLFFSLISLLACILWWGYLRRHPLVSDDPTLNRRSEQYVGRTFKLTEPIVNGRGKIHVDDSMWVVKGADLPVGTVVKIVRAEGVILIAEKA